MLRVFLSLFTCLLKLAGRKNIFVACSDVVVFTFVVVFTQDRGRGYSRWGCFLLCRSSSVAIGVMVVSTRSSASGAALHMITDGGRGLRASQPNNHYNPE